MNIILIHEDQLEIKSKNFILKIYKHFPLFINNITLDSSRQWSTSNINDKHITLGLQWNQTPEDLLCLWIHEQLHAWEPTRDEKWLQYVKENYQNRNMDPQMNQFTEDIDSCFAQHLVVIWNAFNITKMYYPEYIKGDVAYVVLQKFIRDNWERIQQDLQKFNLIYQHQKVQIKGGEKKTSRSNTTQQPQSNISQQLQEQIERPTAKQYVCKCAFSRNKGVKDYTCLVDSELNRLRSIIQEPSKDIYDFYLKLVSNFQCQRSPNGVDQCVKKNLVQKYGDSIEEAFKNALPLENQIDQIQQWLSSSNIDLLANQLEANFPCFKYMGIQTWDMFEDCLKDSSISLSPEFIYTTLQTNPTKTSFGWVLNQCHKYSTGQHWVALGIVRQSQGIKFLYYDSQSKDGPSEGIISCNFREGLQLTEKQKNKYTNYQSKFKQWWYEVQEYMKEKNIQINNTIIHNTFITQNDNFRCGYHAFYFLYLITTEKDKSIDALNLQIMSTQSDSLDKFMSEFQNKVFDLSSIK